MNWRKYAFFLVLLFIAFFFVSGFLIYQNTSRFYQERLDRANYVRSRIDLDKALKSFASIDSGVFRINALLQQKGFEKMKIDNMGGVSSSFDITRINAYADFYQKQIWDLENKLNTVPLGLPSGGEITSSFGYRSNPFTRGGAEFHSGVDYRGHVGDSIKATGSGIVIFAGFKAGYGRCIIIEHKNNMQTLYGHLRQIGVEKGEWVNSGQLIGLMGSSGRSTGPHLHYEIIENGEYNDPEKFVSTDDEKEDYG
ncbi:MAG: M23 family metallopeptidase [Porphyromonadaceae bacterium]|nr:M23 family metallopeptidase [Porphyromonadaceae bacterium]